MFMNKRQIKQAFKYGQLDEVLKQLRTYGTYTYDKTFDVEEGHYAGCNRVSKFMHHGMPWEVHMINGEVKRLGYTVHHFFGV